MAKVTFRRQPDGSYRSSDGRLIIHPDNDHEAVSRGKGPRIYWVTDTVKRTPPGSFRTLRDIRRHFYPET
jgi:hypothetical protein